MTSIAFPSIGIGSLGVPRDEFAQALVEETKAFSQKYGRDVLMRTVYVVIQSRDTDTNKVSPLRPIS